MGDESVFLIRAEKYFPFVLVECILHVCNEAELGELKLTTITINKLLVEVYTEGLEPQKIIEILY